MDIEWDLLPESCCNATAFCSVEDLHIYPCTWMTLVSEILSILFYIFSYNFFKWQSLALCVEQN